MAACLAPLEQPIEERERPRSKPEQAEPKNHLSPKARPSRYHRTVEWLTYSH